MSSPVGAPWAAQKIEDEFPFHHSKLQKLFCCFIVKSLVSQFFLNSSSFSTLRPLALKQSYNPSHGFDCNISLAYKKCKVFCDLFIKMCLRLFSEEAHVTPRCHHKFIKWLCTIQMKNKIRNTEMEYIARANCRVDSSFLADGSGRVIGALVFFLYIYFYR